MIHTYSCPNCGVYTMDTYVPMQISGNMTSPFTNISKLKLSLFYYLRVIKQNDKINHFKHPNVIHIFSNKTDDSIDLKLVYNLYPKTFSKKIDMIMELLNTEINDIGKSLKTDCNVAFLLTNTDSDKKARLNLLKDMDYIKVTEDTDDYTFTPRGWEKIDSLQRNRKSQTAFIAMSFKRKKDNNGNDLLQDAEDTIISAIKKAGYTPVIIKDKEHNQSIPQQIAY